jgi:hypothetical protein
MPSLINRRIDAVGANGGSGGVIDSTGANLLILVVKWYSGTTQNISVNDSKSNTWLTDPTLKYRNSGSSESVQLFYCRSSPTVGTNHSASVTGAETYAVLAFLSFNVESGVDFREAVGNANGTGVSTRQPGSLTPAVNDALIITGCNGDTTSSFAVDSGFSAQSINYGAGNNIAGATAYLIQSTAAAVNPEWTFSGGVGPALLQAVFSATPAPITKTISDTLDVAISESLTQDEVPTVTGIVEVLGTQLNSIGHVGTNDPTKVLDDDLTTYWQANSDSQYVGTDPGGLITPVGFLFATVWGEAGDPEPEHNIRGAKIQSSPVSDFSSGTTDEYTFGTGGVPFYQSHYRHRINFTPSGAVRHWRFLFSSGRKLAAFSILASAGATRSAKPIDPKIVPWGGLYPGQSTVSTILTSDTTSAQLYYTTDGTTPDNTDTLYTGTFNLSIGDTTTLKVIAYQEGLDQPYSRVVTATFHNHGWKHDGDVVVTDDRGLKVDAHSGDIKWFVDRYWWYGNQSYKYNAVNVFGGGVDANGSEGIALYSSPNLYPPWKFEGHILPKIAAYDYVLRPHVLYNALTSKYVLWAYGYDPSPTLVLKAVVATSDNPNGPWTWVNEGFLPNGLAYFADNCVAKDPDSVAAYVAYAASSAAASVVVSKLSADYTDVDDPDVYVVVHNTFEESPLLRKKRSVWTLLTSGAANYYDDTLTFEPQYQNCRGNDPSTADWDLTLRPIFHFGDFNSLVGTDFNGQLTSIIDPQGIDGAIILLDGWKQDAMHDSDYKFLPVKDLFAELPSGSWDWQTYFNLSYPGNDLDDGLVQFHPLGEYGNAIDEVGSNDGVETGHLVSVGINRHARALSLGDYLTIPDNVANRVGDEHAFIQFWLQMGYQSGALKLIVKYDETTFATNFDIVTDGSNQIRAKWTGTTECVSREIEDGELIMVTFIHDPDLNEIALVINNETPVVASYSGGPTAINGPMLVSHPSQASGYDMFNLGIWKGRPRPTGTELTTWYNSGVPIHFESFGISGPITLSETLNLSVTETLAVTAKHSVSESIDIGVSETLSVGTGIAIFYLRDQVASGSNHYSLVQGSPASTATTGTGWNVDSLVSPNTSRMSAGVERAAGTFGATTQPDSGPDNTLGDSFRTSQMSASFPSGNWFLSIPVIAVTSGAFQNGMFNFKMWKSANADGSSPTSLMVSHEQTSIATLLSVSAEQVLVKVFNPGAFTLTNEYLFLQLAWNVANPSGSTSPFDDVLIRVGPHAYLRGPGEGRLEVLIEDTLNVQSSESISVSTSGNIAKSFSDTLDITATEVLGLKSLITLSDSLDVSVNEGFIIRVTGISIIDTLDVSISESYSLFTGGLIEKTYSDTLDIAVNESIDIKAKFSVTETVSITSDESFSLAFGGLFTKSISDALDISITEGLSVAIVGAVTKSVSDTLDLSTTEVLALEAQVILSDTLDIATSETVSVNITGVISKSISESLDVGLTESFAILAKGISINDTLDISLSESFGIVVGGLVTKSFADTLNITASEVVQEKTLTIISDTLDIATGESLALLIGGVVQKSVSESLDISVSEVLVLVPTIPIAISDTLDISTSESFGIVLGGLVSVSISDTLSVSVSEALSLKQTGLFVKSISDTLDVSINEALTVLEILHISISDALDVTVSEVLAFVSEEINYISVRATLGVGYISIQDVW